MTDSDQDTMTPSSKQHTHTTVLQLHGFCPGQPG